MKVGNGLHTYGIHWPTMCPITLTQLACYNSGLEKEELYYQLGDATAEVLGAI